MPGTAVLDTAVGLAFMFFLVALTCSALVEFISNLVKKRPKYLLRGRCDLLDTPGSPSGPLGLADRATSLRSNISGEKTLYQNAYRAGPSNADPGSAQNTTTPWTGSAGRTSGGPKGGSS